MELIIAAPFIQRVFDVKEVPFDHVAYENSQQNVSKIIARLSYKRSRILKEDNVRKSLSRQITKLRAIEKDLQTALER